MADALGELPLKGPAARMRVLYEVGPQAAADSALWFGLQWGSAGSAGLAGCCLPARLIAVHLRPPLQALFAKAAAGAKLTPLVVERKKYLKAVAAVSFGGHACIARRPAANCLGP